MRNLRIHVKFYSLLVSFIYSLPSFCQVSGQVALRKITEQNGLSDNKVTCVYKDRNDFVWIGTASGLNLMNGSSITVFKQDPHHPNSISNNFINAIAGDANGFIWIGTQNGLNSYDAAGNRFTRYMLQPGSPGFINCLSIDKKNNLYAGTTTGLFYLDKKTKKLYPIAIPGKKKDFLVNHNITGLAIDATGKVWFTNFNGLWSYDAVLHKTLQEATVTHNQSPTLFTSLCIAHNGKIWAGTWSNGLIEFDPLNRKMQVYPYEKNITSIAEIKDADKGYLICLNGNFKGFNPNTGKFIQFSIPHGIPKETEVNNLYTSNNNWLWMGTKDGLIFYNPEKTLFRHHIFDKDITGQDVPLIEWNGNILAGGEGKYFLKLYNDTLQELADYSYAVQNNYISCLSLAFSGRNELKVGTNHGILDIDLSTQKKSYDPLQYLVKNNLSDNFITGLLKDHENNWWVLPWRNGIWKQNRNENMYKQVLRYFIRQGGFPKPLVVSEAVEDQYHNIWFADLDEGIILYKAGTQQFSKPFEKQLGRTFSTAHLLYYKDQVFSFSGTHIFYWNTTNFLLEQIELPVQMDKPISAIAMDSLGHLWMATQQGLLLYNFNTKKYERFTVSDGLVTNDMEGTLYCKKNGVMIFGSAGYLTAFRPAKLINALNVVPHIRLAEVMVNGRTISFDTTKTMKFGPRNNHFTITWAVTDYNNPLQNHYYYKLKGIDKDWRYAGTHGEVEFANLSPGYYHLLLKGENANEINADKIISLQFYIRPPIWLQWWFAALVLLAIVVGLYILYRYRINQFLKIEKLRNKISIDLHDDIGSTLSSISILSEIALHQKSENETENMLREIKESSLSLMERMDDIVWSINPGKDSLESLLLRIKTFAAKIFEAKGINYTFHIHENIRQLHLPMETRQHIYLIMKEAINNLVKHSGCHYAEIYVDYKSSLLTIIIKDDGGGFYIQNSSTGNGLSSMKKRAAEIKGTLTVHSGINEGTAIGLKVKIG